MSRKSRVVSSPGPAKNGRLQRLHLLASLTALLAGGVLATVLIRPGETAQDPAAPGATETALQHADKLDRTALIAPDVYGPLLAPLRQRHQVPAERETQVEIAAGDTLMKVLVKAGVPRDQAHLAIKALAKEYDPRRLRPGQELTLTFTGQDDKTATLTRLALHASVDEDVVASLTDDGFRATSVTQELERRPHRASARIDSSLFIAAERARVPVPVILELIRLYSFDVDFQRDIQPGDGFEVLFESEYTEDGTLARHGEILYAELKVRGTTLPLYRYETSDGQLDYFNDQGHSVRKALMKTPIDGARLSSRFGMRRHPILGYRKKHRGIDFAAPTGTPIMAAGNGTVEVAGRNGAYGRYIRIRHNGEYKTAYAHLSKYARGVRKGKRVKQGQIIGYVGSSGRSTGPHLHYEVLRGNRQINPLGLKLPTGRKLKGDELARFEQTRERTVQLLAAAPSTVDLAQND